MSIKSKSFIVGLNDTPDNVSFFLQNELGLDAYLVIGIQSTQISSIACLLTVLYKDYDEEMVSSISPIPGSIISTGISNLEMRVLFNDPIDPYSVGSGTFRIDNTGVNTGRYTSSLNSYYLKSSLSGFSWNSYHDYRIDSSKFTRSDGSRYPYSFIGNYTVNDQGLPTFDSRVNKFKPRGAIKVEVVRATPNSYRQALEQFLNNNSITQERLLAHSSVSFPNGTHNTYIIYILKPEPQVISSSPLNNSLLPAGQSPDYVNFLFSTSLDINQVTTQSGLFSIESGHNARVNISPSHISISPDGRIVSINSVPYIQSNNLYSITINPGIRSDQGFVKTKPDIWNLQLDSSISSNGSVVSTGAYDHGSLNGLSDDDHPHYLTSGRANTWIDTNLSFTGHTHIIAHSGAPPSSYEKPGMNWLDTSTANLYIWYSSIGSSQWVQIC